MAHRMDGLAHVLWAEKLSGNLDGCKKTLLDSHFLGNDYFADTERELGISTEPHALHQAERATDWEELNEAIHAVGMNMLLSLMACWDLELCQSYFSAMQPFPLFEIVMLQTSHDLSVNPRMGRDTLHRPVRNFLDLVAMMGAWQRNPAAKRLQTVRVKDMATWLELGSPQIPEQKLWNWRSSRDAFLIEDLDLVWRRFSGEYDNGIATTSIPPPPLPLFAATAIWNILQVQRDFNSKRDSLFLIQPWYLWWWKSHLVRLEAKGFAWGNRPWPASITNQSSCAGFRSSDSSLSCQSSGRSSKSRDSQ